VRLGGLEAHLLRVVAVAAVDGVAAGEGERVAHVLAVDADPRDPLLAVLGQRRLLLDHDPVELAGAVRDVEQPVAGDVDAALGDDDDVLEQRVEVVPLGDGSCGLLVVEAPSGAGTRWAKVSSAT
jgi:hypothetical protein